MSDRTAVYQRFAAPRSNPQIASSAAAAVLEHRKVKSCVKGDDTCIKCRAKEPWIGLYCTDAGQKPEAGEGGPDALVAEVDFVELRDIERSGFGESTGQDAGQREPQDPPGRLLKEPLIRDFLGCDSERGECRSISGGIMTKVIMPIAKKREISHTDERRRYHRRQDLSQTGKRTRARAWRQAGIIGMIHTAIITARV